MKLSDPLREIETYWKMIYGITIDEEYLCTDTHENDLDFQHDDIIGLIFKEINTK